MLVLCFSLSDQISVSHDDAYNVRLKKMYVNIKFNIISNMSIETIRVKRTFLISTYLFSNFLLTLSKLFSN